MVERYQSTDGLSFLPVARARPFLQALPVRFDTPTAWAAWVKFTPSSASRRTCSARLASRIAFLVG